MPEIWVKHDSLSYWEPTFVSEDHIRFVYTIKSGGKPLTFTAYAEEDEFNQQELVLGGTVKIIHRENDSEFMDQVDFITTNLFTILGVVDSNLYISDYRHRVYRVIPNVSPDERRFFKFVLDLA